MLDPVMDPHYNIRECCKQCVLLEDHLRHEKKRCPDCITKHFLTIEGLLEEAASLDRDRSLPRQFEIDWPDGAGRTTLDQIVFRIAALQQAWSDGADPEEIQQWIRAIRKGLQPYALKMADGTSCSSCASSVRRTKQTAKTDPYDQALDLYLERELEHL